ncbi:MAG: malyl-CoA lyase [Rhodospirillaceae bacterium]|nr:MAG: malyl-CoA lyase [Rhodospirillaceae bacterium]
MLTDAAADGARAFHWGDMWHYALARMVVAARANGLRPVDGPFGDFKDEQGYLAAARRAASLGCEGKMVIHPSQITIANTLFSPSEAEITQARRILDAMAAAEKAGAGAVSLEGKMIDIASIRQAQVVVKKADMITAQHL